MIVVGKINLITCQINHVDKCSEKYKRVKGLNLNFQAYTCTFKPCRASYSSVQSQFKTVGVNF